MVRKKQVNNENGAVLNRDFPRRGRSLIMVPEELRGLYPNAKPEYIEMAMERHEQCERDEGESELELVKDDEIYIPILLAAYYGLRRSEVIGLKWSAIDFTENTLTVRHTVHSTEEGIVAKDRLKTKSSYRTLTLEPFVRGELIKHREKPEQMKKVMRSAYSKEYTDYVCVDALGKLYDPDFVTGHFGQLLKKHNLKKIRFHDLRHSCASVLLAQGVPMKQIQEWLGHSDMSTTANIYSHLDAVTKADTGAAMSKALG